LKMQRIAVVGVGPRGLSVVERVLSYAELTGRKIDLLLFEPQTLGVGVHSLDLPDYLLLNTVAGQITAFPDEAMVPDAPFMPGPSFLAWCGQRGLTVPASWSAARPAAVAEHHFMPRRLYGEYLEWSAALLLAQAPDCVQVTVKKEIVTNVRPCGEEAELTVGDGSSYRADLAIVTTGHGLHTPPRERNGSRGLVERCYLLPEKLAGIDAGQRVAIAGMGLTAIDVVAALTVGRGGRFQKVDGALRYAASGREPRMVLFNRRGWLPCARPALPRRTPPQGGTGALTLDALAEMRKDRIGGCLSYSEDLEPLIRREVEADDLEPEERRALARVLGQGRETWWSEAEFHAAVVAQARQDLTEAALGLGASRIKNRLEVLRDRREVLRSSVDAPGLTAAGHRDFFHFLPALANRAAVGPQLERSEELMSLMDAGLVRLGPGPGARLEQTDSGWSLTSTALGEKKRLRADFALKAHIDTPELDPAIDPLSRSLRDWGAAHPADSRYLRLERDGRVLTRSGATAPVAVFGPPAEGANYYNNYVLWPGTWSRLLTDIDRALRPLFKQM
jgi:hypothetical protein